MPRPFSITRLASVEASSRWSAGGLSVADGSVFKRFMALLVNYDMPFMPSTPTLMGSALFFHAKTRWSRHSTSIAPRLAT